MLLFVDRGVVVAYPLISNSQNATAGLASQSSLPVDVEVQELNLLAVGYILVSPVKTFCLVHILVKPCLGINLP